MRAAIVAVLVLGAIALGGQQQATAQEGPYVAVQIVSIASGQNSCIVYDSDWQRREIPRQHAFWIAAIHWGWWVWSTCIIDYAIDVAPGGYCLVHIDGVTYWLRYRIDFNTLGQTVIICNGWAEFVTT